MIFGRSVPLKNRYLAQAAAKKSWQNRDLPNWRDRVDDLLKGKQIIVNGLREWNSIYVAARRRNVQSLRFKISDSEFAVVAEGIYGRKIKFIEAGNPYYTRKSELDQLFKATQKLGVHLDYCPIKEQTKDGIVKAIVARQSGLKTPL